MRSALRPALTLLPFLGACAAPPPPAAGPATRQFELQHVGAAELLRAIESWSAHLLLERRMADGRWVALATADDDPDPPPGGSLQLRGDTEPLQCFAELVQRLDRNDLQLDGASGREAVLAFFLQPIERRVAIRHRPAAALADELRAALTACAAGAGAEAGARQVSWFDGIADTASNSIVVRGRRYLVEDALLAIRRSDVPPAPTSAR